MDSLGFRNLRTLKLVDIGLDPEVKHTYNMIDIKHKCKGMKTYRCAKVRHGPFLNTACTSTSYIMLMLDLLNC